MERPISAAVKEPMSRPCVIQLAVILLQPVLELEAHLPAVGLVARHVGDGAHPEEGIEGARRRPAGRGLQ